MPILHDQPVGRAALVGEPWFDEGDEFRPEVRVYDLGTSARLVTEPEGREFDLTVNGIDQLIAALTTMRGRLAARVEADTAQLLLEIEALR